MENRGYEEEQLRAEQNRLAHESRYRDRQLRSAAIDDGPFVATRITVHPESHVYEDISASTGDSVGPTEPRILLTEDTQNIRVIEELGRQASWIGGPSSAANDNGLNQQIATLLSSSAGISANHDSSSNESSGLYRTSEDAAESSSGEVRRESSGLPRGDGSGGGDDGDGDVAESVSTSARENEDSLRDAPGSQPDRRPVANRRRRKKDCKHCRSKLAAAGSCEKLDELAGSKDAILNDGDRRDHAEASDFLFRDSLLRPQNIKIYPIVNRTSLRDGFVNRRSSLATFPVSANGPRLTERAAILMNAGINVDKMLTGKGENDPSKIPGALRNGTDMRINSIYSQDRWYGKETPIFYTDVKDQNPFQRAYSLPVRTHTPASQNRVNLRRSVRNEPPPHPARLDKHRRGWTLHLARPLKASGCSSPLVPLLIVVLILLGVAGVALYIVFEPEKLQIIQQYLKSSTGKLTGQNVTSGELFTPTIPNDEPNLTISTTGTTSSASTATATTGTTTTTKTSADDAFTVGALLNGEQPFPEIALPSTDAETEAAYQDANATRHCDDCLEGEVCVALVDEEVPICKWPRDREDPTGCAGFCVINKQKCHRLDVDAFRCVEIEHYCLDDEWTCSNALCIPLEKRCDGHMNCYDHSDEYDCECNPETHFQCGNETSCLPLERRCDGKIDCWDATDEINCTLGRNRGWSCPLENEFTCSNGECILKVRFCDGLPDCSDGSDEPHGCQGRCNKHEFTCQNGRCITKGMKCNGVDDCGDGTDERYCKDRFI